MPVYFHNVLCNKYNKLLINIIYQNYFQDSSGSENDLPLAVLKRNNFEILVSIGPSYRPIMSKIMTG